MKKYIFCVSGLIIALSLSAVAAQPPAERWITRYASSGNSSDGANAMAVDSSGNVYVTGYTYVGGNPRSLTIKYDQNGNQLWAVQQPGGNGTGLAVDDTGNIYVMDAGSHVVWKYSSTGATLWIGGVAPWPNGLKIDNSGNVYTTGSSSASGGSPNSYSTMKLDPNGNMLWYSEYDGPQNMSEAYGLAIDNSGNVYVTGYTYAGNGSDFDYATVKYDANGNQLWAKRYSRTGHDNNFAYAIGVDNSGNVYVTGGSYASGIGNNYATVKYDPNGNQLWVAVYNGPVNGDRAKVLAIDNSGNVYVTGLSSGVGTNGYDYATIKYNSDGNQLWVARYKGPGQVGCNDDQANAMALDDSGNVYVTGYSYGTGADYTTI